MTKQSLVTELKKAVHDWFHEQFDTSTLLKMEKSGIIACASGFPLSALVELDQAVESVIADNREGSDVSTARQVDTAGVVVGNGGVTWFDDVPAEGTVIYFKGDPHKLTKPVSVGGLCFHPGVSVAHVLRAGERRYEYEQSPEYKAQQAERRAQLMAGSTTADRESAFKNFHRSLCARFGYTHDPEYWWRDLVSLEEHIAKQSETAGRAVPATQS